MWQLADKEINSRLLIGSALYPSPNIMQDAIRAAKSDVVTVSLRRQAAGSNAGDGGHPIWQQIHLRN